MFCLMWMVDLATPFSLQMMETGQEMFIILDIAVFVSVRPKWDTTCTCLVIIDKYGNVINCPHAWQQFIVLMNSNIDRDSFLSSVFRINWKIKGTYANFSVIFLQKGRNCSEPAVVNNAMLMTKRAMHRYMDKITYMCDLGYVKSRGEETFTCGSDGQWTPSQTTNLLECSGQW